MATRSERFKSDEQRTRARATHSAGTPAGARPSSVDKRKLKATEVSGTVHEENGVRNLSRGKGAGYALEETVGSDRPSRKATRRSARTHLKAATQLTARQKSAVVTPARRHDKGK
jgi:hypothetical protein